MLRVPVVCSELRADKKGLLRLEKWTQDLELLEMMEDFPNVDKLGMAVGSQRGWQERGLE